MKSAAHPPTGTVTFLFTDIVGSTELWETHGDGFLPILQAHNAILTDAISRFGGFLIKTEGDAYKIAFENPVAAAKCAVVAQAALQRYPWPADVGALRVRMSIHTGEPFMQGADYFGSVVNRAARILSATHGGQITLSEETRSQLVGTADSETGFLDLGYHTLKDLGQPARLYQVEHPALDRRNFPPPSSLNGHANNLPCARRSFVGRQKEIERIAGILARDDAAVLQLSGPAGIGKTRLAIQAAAERIERFPDGVWYVALKRASDAEEAALEVADMLGVQIPSGTPALSAVREWFAQRQALLILDDCGSVPQAPRLIREILSGNSALRCLAIARESMAIGEELCVPEMGMPEDNPTADSLMRSESGQLFVERAHESQREFALNDRRATAISRLIRRVRPSPAAIERAAGMLSPEAITGAIQSVGREVSHAAAAAAARGRSLLERLKASPELQPLIQSLATDEDRAALTEAESIERETLERYRQLGDKSGIASSLRRLGNLAFARKDYRRAVTLLTAALQAATDVGSTEVDGISVDLAFARRAHGEMQGGVVSFDHAYRVAIEGE